MPPRPSRQRLRDIWLVAGVGVVLAVAGWLLRSTRLGVGLDDTAQFVAGVVAWLTCRRAARSPYAVPRAWTLAGRASLSWAIGEAILSFQHIVLNSTTRPHRAFGRTAGFAFPRTGQTRAGRCA